MEVTFWNFFVRQTYRHFYLKSWKLFTTIAIYLSAIVPLAIALCGIADIAFWKKCPELAFVATIISAIWQAVSAFLPWQSRAIILGYSIREMGSFCLEMEIYWDAIGTQSDGQIREKLSEFRVTAYNIEENYYGAIDYIPHFWYALYAEFLSRRYFKSQFEVDIIKKNKENENETCE